ncbi:MAG TPA: hypothetical protein VF517_03825 [Thermoleophilaceae bacterium]|jgi:hypothetical protein
MADDDAEWVLPPAEPGDWHVFVSMDEEAQLSPRLKDAVKRLGEAAEAENPKRYAAKPNNSCFNNWCGENEVSCFTLINPGDKCPRYDCPKMR